jgi:hypothetical protein
LHTLFGRRHASALDETNLPPASAETLGATSFKNGFSEFALALGHKSLSVGDKVSDFMCGGDAKETLRSVKSCLQTANSRYEIRVANL